MAWPPSVILCVPRSGSSLVTGIFHLHGCWVGTQRPKPNPGNPKGFFENGPIKKFLGETFLNPDTAEDITPADMLGAARRDGYEDGPWAVKITSLYRNAFADLSPYYVKVIRDYEGNRAAVKKGWSDAPPDKMKRFDQMYNELIDAPGVEVFTDPMVVDGDLSRIRDAVEGYGLSFDEGKTREFIDKTLWHH